MKSKAFGRTSDITAACAIALGLCLFVDAQAGTAVPATVSLPSGQSCPGGDTVVPVRVDPADGVIGLDLGFTYDPSLLHPTHVYGTALSSGLTLVPNISTPGEIELALFGTSALAGAGDVAWIVFHTGGPGPAVTPLAWTRHDLNEGQIPSVGTNGFVHLPSAGAAIRMPDDANGAPAATVEVPVTTDTGSGFLGVDLVVAWNPQVIQATGVSTGPGLPGDWSGVYNMTGPGEAMIALYGSTPLPPGEQPLVLLQFLVVGNPGDSTPLDVVRGDVNEGDVVSCLDDGLFTICPDGDGDSYTTCGGDCNDLDPEVHPQMHELCDDIDQDCDGTNNEGVPADACDDENPCTDDACGATGCVHTPNDANSCDDADDCTRDLCEGGQCASYSVSCEDENPCTDDACDPESGCYYTPNNANACTDGNACTNDACLDGACTTTPVTCDDANACTDDACDPGIGCHFTADPTNTCSDGSACTTDVCTDGQCVSASISCDDGNPCTADSCNPSTGCAHLPTSGGACSDGNACTTSDVCVSGACVGGTPPNCNDGNTCTTDACDAATGCVNVCNGTCNVNNHSYGFYKRLCRGPHPSGEFLSSNDVNCVNDTCTFASVGSVGDICDRLTPNPPSDKCEHAEAQFMVLMLNVCRCRVERHQPIDAACGPSGTVGDAVDDADAKLCNPQRTRDECILAHCGVDQINTGAALWANTLRSQAGPGGAVILTWSATYSAGSLQVPHGYRIWRRAQSEAAYVQIAETHGFSFTDHPPASGLWEYEVTGIW